MKKSEIHIGLINPKSPANVGAVMRAAGCFGVGAVLYTGGRYDRAEKFRLDTRRARHKIPLMGVDSLLDNLAADMQLVCVELVEGAMPLPEYQHPDRAFYVFGPEDGTIAQDVIDRADAVVYVPTSTCMNLAATINVVLYDRLAKSDLSFAGNELIRRSRDTNNTVRVSAPVAEVLK